MAKRRSGSSRPSTGTDGVTDGESVNWAALAYMAMLADVRERIGDLAYLFETDDDDDDDETENDDDETETADA